MPRFQEKFPGAVMDKPMALEFMPYKYFLSKIKPETDLPEN